MSITLPCGRSRCFWKKDLREELEPGTWNPHECAPQQQEYDQYAVSSWYLLGLCQVLASEVGWIGWRGWEEGHGVDRAVLTKALTVCWWWVLLHRAQGTRYLAMKDSTGQDWVCVSKGVNREDGISSGWGLVGRVCVYLSNPNVRAFTFLFASPGISGPRGGVWFTEQLVAASAELRTSASCSHSARGRLLGKHGGRTPPISPSSGQLPEKRMIVTS